MANSLTSVHPFELLLARDAREQGWSGSLQGAAKRGEVIKLRPGAYVPAQVWAGLNTDQRTRARIHAVALTLSTVVLAGKSAAAIHRLPLVGGELTRVHVLQSTANGSGTRSGVTVHAYSGDPDIVSRDGLWLTSPARTVLDLARTLPHHEALIVADAAVRPIGGRTAWGGTGRALCNREDLVDRATALVGQRGGWNAYLIVSAADPGAESAGESFARSVMMRLGAPAPVLQAPIYDAAGLIGYSDFLWLEYGVIGEFDGFLKYGADNPSGTSASRVVYDEKLREDRMRRVGHTVIRFGWRDLEQPQRLARLLHGAGIPLHQRDAWPELRHIVRAAGV